MRCPTYRCTRSVMDYFAIQQLMRAKELMSQRILLIQDDAAAAKAILNALSNSKDEPFQVEWVRSCSEGLERLAGSAAILVDLSLPDSRGIETFGRAV